MKINNIKKAAATALCMGLVFSLSACTNQDVGVLTGGAIGGAVGSLFGRGSGKIFATAGGAVLGAFIGGRIGHSMDKVDQMRVQRALNNSPTGHATHWHNPDSGNTYYVKPTKTYYRQTSHGDQPCRDFTTTAIIGTKKETVYGRACRKADGTWQIVQK